MMVAGDIHTVDLKFNGPVVVGRNEDVQFNIGFWSDVVQVAAGKMLLLDG